MLTSTLSYKINKHNFYEQTYIIINKDIYGLSKIPLPNNMFVCVLEKTSS